MAGNAKLKKFAGKVIAIDGPAGSGKSTIARRVAERLGMEYLDTGALYRAVAWRALERKLDINNPDQLRELLSDWEIRLESDGPVTRVFYRDKEITEEIRSPEVTAHVSEVADHPKIREFLVLWQQKRIAGGGVVLEGRDTGTVVAPKADVKIYLDGNLRTRAERRLLEYAHRGVNTSLEEQVEKLAERDRRDFTRPVGALKKAEDAITIDTTNLNIEQVTDAVLRVCHARMAQVYMTGDRG
jgi:cytidylate kinase